MYRIRRFMRETTLGVLLTMAWSIPAAIPPSHLAIAAAGTVVISTAPACGGPNSLEELNTVLNRTAHALEAAIDTNGRLYEAGAYGGKGTPGAIVARQRIATVIHNSNEYLIGALEIAKGLTKETFESNKLAILEKLTAAAGLLKIGQPQMDLVLQGVASLINQAVVVAQLFKAGDVKHMRRIIPMLNAHLTAFGRIRDKNPIAEVFAE
jgi:hypothetical protein